MFPCGPSAIKSLVSTRDLWMKEETIFVAEDGSKFDNKEDCVKWESISRTMGAVDEYFRDMVCPSDDFEPLKELIDRYLEDLGLEIGELQMYFWSPVSGRCPEPTDPKVRIKHLELLMKILNYVFYGSINPCVGD